MKFTTLKRKVAGDYTRDGVTIPVERVESVRMPVLPRDWYAVTLRGVIITNVVLSLFVITWSTWSIGSLLGGGVIGYMVAVIFDIGWIVALALETLSRYDEEKRQFPHRLGWGLLIVTMIAIGVHGFKGGDWQMGVFGACVSLFAKLMWIAVMKHVNADLTADDKAWLRHRRSEVQAKAALAQMKRQFAKEEQRTTLVHLAMEREVAEVRAAFGLDTEDAPTVEQLPARPALDRPTLADMKVSDAVRYVKTKLPELEADEIVDVLSDEGVEATRDYVAQILKRTPVTEETIPLAEVVDLRK